MRAAIGRPSLKTALTTTALKGSAAIAFACIFALPAMAQDSGAVTSYRLPEAGQTSAPRAQGPVDPDNPYAPPSNSSPVRPVTPTPSAPQINLPPVTASPAPSRQPARTEDAPRSPRQQASPTPEARQSEAAPSIGSALPSDTPDAAPAPTTATPPPVLPSSNADDAPLVQAPAKSDSDGAFPWWIAGLAGVAALAGGAFWMRRRRQADLVEEPFAEPVPVPTIVPPRQPRPVVNKTAAAPTPAAAPPPAPPRAPVAQPVTAGMDEALPLSVAFTPIAVRLSLVYATLQYEVVLTNAGAAPLTDVHIRADLSSAHASIPVQQQLAPAPDQLDVRHAIATLAAGETLTLKGELRVPLPQIRPLVKGNAQFFVPLVRLCLTTANDHGIRRVFTAGPLDPGTGALASIRLDAGPRNLRELAAREIEAARAFPLDRISLAS
ncbi:hypothetical protein NS277_05605 [Novosphingobium barchaimii]|nr:hypothetical protein NS277_05605 [Novosphingobium barchaimii]